MNRCAMLWPALAGLLAGCAASIGPSTERSTVQGDRPVRVARGLDRGRSFLLLRRAPDHTWRSESYSSFGDGASLTPLAVLALLDPQVRTPPDGPVADGAAYLAKLVTADGTIDAGRHGLSYPVYSAALAVRILSQPRFERSHAARDVWLADLRARQLDESLGWSPDDPHYGGWGYCHSIPRKPKPGEYAHPLLESNLSATVFALDALRAAGVPTTDAGFRKALAFVSRCQNLADGAGVADGRFDDGGFTFVLDDAARNKPGPAGTDRRGRTRYHSYGSATADGLRALRQCGLPGDHPRAQAALTWLRQNFDGAGHPGAYPPERAGERDAVYYYYAWSLAQSLEHLPPKEARHWATCLSDGLLDRQQPDGSWRNPCKAVREDDPVLATALATAALAWCQPLVAE